MFPILRKIPNISTMAGEIVVLEVVVGAVCLLCWIALKLRNSSGWAISVFSTGAILVGLHLLLSTVMETDLPITIYSFGVVVILAFLAGVYFLTRQTARLHLPTHKVFDWGFWLLVTGIVGSRFLFAFLNYDLFRDDKLLIFKIWHGGLVWYGGLIPAVAVGVWLLRRYKLPVLHVTDACAVALMLALGIGRWACLMAGDDYGARTDAWLGIRFYHRECLIPGELRGELLHPTQLYMSLNALWLFFILEAIRRRARFAGQAFAWMLILYAVTRFVVIEPFRGDFVERNPGWGKHVAVAITVEKDKDSAPVRLERGATVTGADGRTGRLLEDLDLDAGQARGTVWALSDKPAEPVAPESPLFREAGRTGEPPRWAIATAQGLGSEARIQSAGQRWYHSDLPPPPGYVSTSQWISLLVVAAGIGILLVARRLNEPGYAEAVANAVPSDAAAEPSASS
ncbi:MAG: prolipoprotein diacylglyceryl transferase [Planctomycetota bacterium]|jgi:phosphatidylglycerol:prolipoprotein diacylglycerol transferase